MLSQKAKLQSPTRPLVRSAVPAECSFMDFQQHYLTGQGKTGCLPYPWTRLLSLSDGITSALMMTMTKSRKFPTKTGRPSLQRRKRRIKIRKKRSQPGKMRRKGHDQVPRRSNQRMWPVRPHRPRRPPKFRRRRPQSRKRRRNRKRMLVPRSFG